MNTAIQTKHATASHPCPSTRVHKRLSIWERARGMWKGRTPDPVQELARMRKEWDRTVHATERKT